MRARTIAFEFRFAEKPDQYPDLAAELVGLKVDVIVVRTGSIGPCGQGGDRTIPIVMVGSADAVGQGIVASLARPGGNVTGLTTFPRT